MPKARRLPKRPRDGRRRADHRVAVRPPDYRAARALARAEGVTVAGLVARLVADELARRVAEAAARQPPTAPLTAEQAQAAYDEAVPVPLSQERIDEIVRYATGKGPPPAPPAK